MSQQSRTSRRDKHLFWSGAVALGLFVVLIGVVIWGNAGLDSFSFLVYELVGHLHGDQLSRVMYFFTSLANPLPYAGFVILALFLLMADDKRQFLVAILVALTVSSAIVYLTKYLTDIDRPLSHFGIIKDTQSFPSGHVASITVLLSALYHIGVSYIKRRWVEYVLLAAVTTIIFMVAMSRLYLQVHWPIDVLGGFLVGVIGSVVGILAERAFTRSRTVVK